MTNEKLLTAILMRKDGRHTIKGLYDENGNPVEIMLEKENELVMLNLICVADEENSDISEEEIQRVCETHENCDDCPLNEYCEKECEDYYGDYDN